MPVVIRNITYEQIGSTETARIPYSGVSKECKGVVRVLPFVTISEVRCKVVELSTQCFNRCKNITEIILPDTITTIKQYAFAFLTIERLFIPRSVTLVESFIVSDFAPKQIIFCGTKEPVFKPTEGNSCFSSLFHGEVIVPFDYEPEKTQAF